MSSLVLVDTSAWICFFARRGYPDIKEALSLLLEEDRAAIAGPIMIEIVQGARTAEEKEDIKKWIKGICWLSVTDAIWNNAAEMAFALRRKGITTSAIDTLIAALAIEYDCSLLHRDSHFDLVSRHCELKCYSL
jgi:predicted nucleic acid-binding protein